jgi:mannitol/fructose-specific phosphotransferase system IIA component (Ntr-type)
MNGQTAYPAHAPRRLLPFCQYINLTGLFFFSATRLPTGCPLLLTDLLSVERIKIPLQAQTKEELLRELVDVCADAHGIEDRADVLRAVRERESVLSTGIGHGVAIPHGKSTAVGGLRMAAGRGAQPIDFDALDGEPVSLFFLLVGPESAAGPHIKALSRISRLVRRDDVRERLVAATSPEEFMQALQQAETWATT